MTVTGSNYIKGTILFIRDYLRNNVTDPISGSRPAGQQFVLTSYPDKPVVYPILTVKKGNTPLSKLGEQSNAAEATINGEIRIWARNEIERDALSQAVGYNLVKNQFPGTTSGTSLNNNLYDFEVTSTTEIDETGKQGIKSTVFNVQYKTIVI